MKRSICKAVALVMLACAAAASADDKANYNKRAAERFVSLFQSLDRNGDGAVTRDEAKGDLTFVPRFDDMDIDRNGIVSAEELRRFIEAQFGVMTVTTAGK
jgi:Ca2+-binding EF-hand superfamily protein